MKSIHLSFKDKPQSTSALHRFLGRHSPTTKKCEEVYLQSKSWKMESSWHDFSERCAVPWPAPWIVKPGGRGTEYDPGTLSFTPPISMATNIFYSTECAWDDSCIYPPSNSAFVPAASIIVDQQCVSPNSAQYDSVERRDGEGGSVHPEADCDSLRSQQRLFNHPLAPLCLSKITGQDICLSICIEKTK